MLQDAADKSLGGKLINKAHEEPYEEYPDSEIAEQPESRWKKLTVRLIALILALALLLIAFAGVLRIIGIPGVSFLIESATLAQNPRIRTMMQAVVRVQADNRYGTGFNIDENGLIVTNSHITADADLVKVSFLPDRVQYQIEEWQDYSGSDLAFIELDSQELPVLELEQSKTTENEEDLILIGNPLGFFRIASRGTLIGYANVQSISTPVLMIRSQVHRGSSGSPVLNRDGKVIGVVFATVASQDSENPLALAIPVSEIIRLLNDE